MKLLGKVQEARFMVAWGGGWEWALPAKQVQGSFGVVGSVLKLNLDGDCLVIEMFWKTLGPFSVGWITVCKWAFNKLMKNLSLDSVIRRITCLIVKICPNYLWVLKTLSSWGNAEHSDHSCGCILSHFSHVQTLCNAVVCSLPGSSVHGILQARTLEWIALPSSRGSSQPRDWTCISYVSCIGRCVLYHALHQPVLKSLVCLSSDLFEY